MNHLQMQAMPMRRPIMLRYSAVERREGYGAFSSRAEMTSLKCSGVIFFCTVPVRIRAWVSWLALIHRERLEVRLAEELAKGDI